MNNTLIITIIIAIALIIGIMIWAKSKKDAAEAEARQAELMAMQRQAPSTSGGWGNTLASIIGSSVQGYTAYTQSQSNKG